MKTLRYLYQKPRPKTRIVVPGEALLLPRETLRLVGQTYSDYVGFFSDDRLSDDGSIVRYPMHANLQLFPFVDGVGVGTG